MIIRLTGIISIVVLLIAIAGCASSYSAQRTPWGTVVFSPDEEPSEQQVAVQDPGGTAAIELASVTVEPVEIPAGGEINILLDYDVEGLGQGEAVTVFEQRRLLKDGQQLGVFNNEANRTTGEYVSSQSVRVPVNAEPGYYEIEATTSLLGSSDSGRARRVIFRVMPQ